MINISDLCNSADPVFQAYQDEFAHLFLCFCSFVCLLYNKKLNLANLFILVMKDDDIRALYKSFIDCDEDYEALKLFLEYDQSLYKSKYIKNYLNKINDQ